MCPVIFLDTVMYFLIFYGRCYCHVLKASGVPWQMLLPYIYIVADVFGMSYVVNGVTTEADGITSC